MDILRKMFKNDGKANDEATDDTKNAFKKPQWFEETETDDELFDDNRKFAFQVFTNPIELQKHFEQQVQKIMEAMSEFEDNDAISVEKNLKDDFLKPGFESSILKEFEKQNSKSFIDTDLDGEIYADQLHSLMQRLTGGGKDKRQEEPQIGSILPRNDNKHHQQMQGKKRPTDEETILCQIHGTLGDEDDARPAARLPRSRPDTMMPMVPRGGGAATPFGGVFEGTYSGPKMFSQSIMTKTTRKPDGTYETTKITQDSHGNKTTTVTRTINGKSETITTHDSVASDRTNGQQQHQLQQQQEQQQQQRNSSNDNDVQNYSDRNVFVSKDGYALPLNLW